jgi:hypothetical protein
MSMPPPTLGLRGEYNPELRKREEWARLAATLTALETMKEGIVLLSIYSTCGADPISSFARDPEN